MKSLGPTIRKLRTLQSRTLQEIAASCGFTPSLLSKIEHGRTVPPISTLTKIADALGVRVSSLLDEGHVQGTVFEEGAECSRRLTTTSKGYSFYAFALERAEKAFQPYLFTAEKNKVKRNPLSHRGQEFVYMLEGEMRYRVGPTEYTLRPGDSLYFDSALEHDLEPISKSVRYVAVFSERDQSVASPGLNGTSQKARAKLGTSRGA